MLEVERVHMTETRGWERLLIEGIDLEGERTEEEQ